MRILRITLVILLATMLGLFVYANTRYVSPAEKLRSVNIAFFELRAVQSSGDRSDLEAQITKSSGVTACTISREGDLAAVVFHPDVVTEEKLASLLQQHGNVSVSKKTFNGTGGVCPIHAASATFHQMLSSIDFRN
jgi:hypothetical protein